LGSGSSPDDVPDASTAEDDIAFEKAYEHTTALYKGKNLNVTKFE